nr:integrase, catalytic region, zinc finger, CCHC-type, peptidase aspartic, catalytic [Tanacetum cinerariifolium]
MFELPRPPDHVLCIFYRTSSTSQSANKKQEFVKTDDKKVENKDDEKKRDMSKVKCYNCTKEGHFAKDCKKVKFKDYEYYKTKILLAKKDKDEQVLLAEDQAWMESSSDLDKEINANMVFMAQIEKVLLDSEASSSSADDKISEVSYFLFESKSESEYETSEYYDNTTTYGLFVNDNDDQEIFHECENFPENLIESQINHNESAIDHNDSEGVDKLIRKFNKKIVKRLKRIKKANQQNKDFENQNKDLQDTYDVLKNQATTFEMKNKELNDQLKVLIEKNDVLLAQMNVLKDQLQVKHVVINTHVECQEKYAKLEAERYEYMIRYSAYLDNDKQQRKQIADQEVLYDKMSVQLVELDKHVRNLKNTILEKDFKISKLEECVCNKDLKIEKYLERLNVYENKLHKMGQTNQTIHMIMPSKDTLYTGRKGIDVKRYSRKDLLSCNNSHLGETSSVYICNDSMNVSCNSRLCDLFDENNLFIFDDESVKISPVSKMPFKKKPRDSMNVHSKSKSNKSLPRTVHRWLPKMQQLAEPVAKWIPKILQIFLWIIDSGCSKHMTGNRALLTNYVEKFLGTVRFGNNYFAVIAGYGDVVIGSMSIKKVYYVE